MDSTSVVSTANGIAQAATILWPIVISIITYILGHTHTQRNAKKRAAASLQPQAPKVVAPKVVEPPKP